MSRPIPRRVLALIVAAGFLLAGVGGALVAFWVQAYDARETVAEVCAERAAEGGSQCTDAQLRGEPGAKGEQGEPGADGLGVVRNGQKCVNGVWQVKYTDGTIDYNAGPCGPGEPGATGEPGASGAPGSDGKDGVDGADGADGAPGLPGVDGKDGVGIAAEGVECAPPAVDGTWRWRITYTDGTVDTDAGPCYRPGPLG